MRAHTPSGPWVRMGPLPSPTIRGGQSTPLSAAGLPLALLCFPVRICWLFQGFPDFRSVKRLLASFCFTLCRSQPSSCFVAISNLFPPPCVLEVMEETLFLTFIVTVDHGFLVVLSSHSLFLCGELGR